MPLRAGRSAAGHGPDPAGPSVPLARGRERLWMQLGARSVGGAVWRSPPAPRWASGRAGSH